MDCVRGDPSVGRFWDAGPGRRGGRDGVADLAVGAGISGLAGPVGWGAGLQTHNFFSGSVSTTELFAAAGWRFDPAGPGGLCNLLED